jgi:hypothetical protein
VESDAVHVDTSPSANSSAAPHGVAGLRCMTASTDWPRIGPAAYRATTQEDGLRREANPQADSHFIAWPQVVESVSRSLSRWRHGFKSRWDYECKLPGQGARPEAMGSVNRDSNAKYPAYIPRRIERIASSRKGARIEGGCTRPPLRPALRNPARKVGSQPSNRGTRRRHRGLTAEAPAAAPERCSGR